MPDKKTIIYIIDRLGFGEINQPVQFAKQLPQDEYTCFFILPEEQLKYLPSQFPYYLMSPDLDENMRFFENLQQTENIVAIVISTYYEFSLESRFSLDWVLTTRLPVATILADYVNIENDHIIYNGIHQKKHELRPIPSHMDIISFVPKINYQVRKTFHIFSPYPEMKKLPGEQINRIKAELEVPPDVKLIFFPIAKWAYYQSLLDHNKALYFIMGKIIQKILEYTKEKLFVVHIADYPMLTGDSDNVKIKHFKSLPQAQYNDLAFSSDLILNLNPTSPIVAISILGDIPMVTLINHFEAFTEEIMRILTPEEVDVSIFPFTIFPMGRIKETEQLLRDTPLEGAIIQAQLQNVADTGLRVKALLNRQGGEFEELLRHYKLTLELIASLPTAPEVIERIIGTRSGNIPLIPV